MTYRERSRIVPNDPPHALGTVRTVTRRGAPAAWLILLVSTLIACTPAGAGLRPLQPAPAPSSSSVLDPDAPLSLRAMTYNILGNNVPSDWFPLIARDELVPMVRVPGTVAKIQVVEPDVIAFQEFASDLESADAIEQRLPEFTWLEGPGEHAIAVRTSRFEVLQYGKDVLNKDGELGVWMDRYVDWAQLRDRASGRGLWVLNVHAHAFQSDELAAARQRGIERLVEVMNRLDPGMAEPLVLLGDFNASDTETRPVYRSHRELLPQAGLVYTREVAEQDVSDIKRASSLNRMSAKVAGVDVAKVVRRYDKRIDHIWVPKGTRVTAWAVQTGPGVTWTNVRGKRVPVWTGIVPSDHSPVFADLHFG